MAKILIFLLFLSKMCTQIPWKTPAGIPECCTTFYGVAMRRRIATLYYWTTVNLLIGKCQVSSIMARLKKIVIVLLLLLVFVVGISFSQVDPGTPVDGGTQTGEAVHADQYSQGGQGSQSGQGNSAGQADPGSQGNDGNQGNQSGSGIPGSPGSPDDSGPIEPVNPDTTITPDDPDNPAGPVDTITPEDHSNPVDPVKTDPGNSNDPGGKDTPIPTPEFPSAGIPLLFVIGISGAVFLIRQDKA